MWLSFSPKVYLGPFFSVAIKKFVKWFTYISKCSVYRPNLVES